MGCDASVKMGGLGSMGKAISRHWWKPLCHMGFRRSGVEYRGGAAPGGGGSWS